MKRSAQICEVDRMSDLISRQAAIDALNEVVKDHSITDFDAIASILDLPSAQPEQRWIPCGKCIHADGRHRRCKILDRSINEDYFCYWAERI